MNDPLNVSSINANGSAILLHGIFKGIFLLFSINNSIYPASTVCSMPKGKCTELLLKMLELTNHDHDQPLELGVA